MATVVSHHARTLMLYVALALGLLAIAGLSSLRLLRRLGQFGDLSREGPAP